MKDLSFKPFSVDELMDDEENDFNMIEQMKNLRGTALKK
jgi:hypothetical protein